MAIATTGKEKTFLHLASQAVDEDSLNVLLKSQEPPKQRPATFKEAQIFLDTDNKRLSVYINGELHYVTLTRA